jgi:hypothetical protein
VSSYYSTDVPDDSYQPPKPHGSAFAYGTVSGQQQWQQPEMVNPATLSGDRPGSLGGGFSTPATGDLPSDWTRANANVKIGPGGVAMKGGDKLPIPAQPGGGGGAGLTQGGGAGPEYPLAGPGYQEDWYKTYGNDLMGTPSASEDLYSRGVAGSNPFYDYAQEQTIKAINDAAAARGNFNSSYTMKTIGNAVADLRGQQAHELGILAGQSDQGRFGRYDRGNDYSGDAQRAMENRANMSVSQALDVASKRAGLVGGFYGEAGRESTMATMAAIEAELKRMGLDAQYVQQAMNVFMQSLGSGAQIFGAGGGGGGAGGSNYFDPAKV